MSFLKRKYDQLFHTKDSETIPIADRTPKATETTPTVTTPTTDKYTGPTYTAEELSAIYDRGVKNTSSLMEQYGSNQFSYNPETDANYQAYLKLARENGKLAMEDTLAKASAMTGGYSNSNAQLAGQKIYNQHLSEAEANMGNYYAMALDAFNSNQDTLLNRINMAWAAEDRNLAAQDRAQSDALLKAEYGDYSGLTGLGVSQEAIDKYKANADWATQYAKEQADLEKAIVVAEATGDYTTLYKLLNYSDEQIDKIENSKTMNSYLAEIAKKAPTFDNNEDLEMYLESLASMGYIDPVMAADLYNIYSQAETEDAFTYKQLQDRKWNVVKYGNGSGKDGINRTATLVDEYGNEMTIGEIYDQLKNTIDEETAKDIVKELQKKLQIRSN